MPRIIPYIAKFLPESGVPTTGLRPAPIDLMTAVPKAIGELGEVVGRVGDLIFAQAQKQHKENLSIADTEISRFLTNELREDEQRLLAARGDKAIEEYDNYVGRLDVVIKKLDNTIEGKETINELGYTASRTFKKMTVIEKEGLRAGVLKWAENKKSSFNSHLGNARYEIKQVGGLKVIDLEASSAITYGDYQKSKENIFRKYNEMGLSERDALLALQTFTKRFIQAGIDRDDLTIINKVLAKEFDDELLDTELINQMRDEATDAKKFIDLNTLKEKYIAKIKDPFDIEQKEAIEKEIKKEKIEPEVQQAILAGFRQEINTRQQDVRESERNAEDRIFLMIEANEPSGKILKALRKETTIRPQRRLQIEEQVIRGRYETFKKTDPYYEMRLYNKVLITPDDITDDDLKSVPGKLSVDNSRQLVSFRNSMRKEPAPVKEAYKDMDRYIKQTILQSYGADLVLIMDERGFAMEQILNAKPDATKRAFLASTEFRMRWETAKKAGIDMNTLINPASAEHKKHIDIEGTIEKFRLKPSSRLVPRQKTTPPKSQDKGMFELPPASQHKGRTIIDTVTGERRKSDGTNWVRIE